MGSIFRVHYTVADKKTGKRIRKKSKKWYIEYRLPSGEVKREPAYEDKLASQALLDDRIRTAAREDVGIYDRAELRSVEPIGQHVRDFLADCRHRGCTSQYVDSINAKLDYILSAGGIGAISEIVPSRVNAALARLLESTDRGGRGVGPSTRNRYFAAIRAFVRWLIDDQRLKLNPIASVREVSTKGKERRQRVPLSPEDFARLIAVTTGSRSTRVNLAGADRAALYIAAAYTGYRRNELATLTRKSFDLAGPDPRVSLAAAASKRDRPESIPIPQAVAEFFRGYLALRPAGAVVWPVAYARTSEAIRADLADAGVALPQGTVRVDFHSLRQTFVTGLALAGVAPKVAQQLARHSTINLTMNTYAKVGDAHERAAVESVAVPNLLAGTLAEEPPKTASIDRQSPPMGSCKRPTKTAGGRMRPNKKSRKNTENAANTETPNE